MDAPLAETPVEVSEEVVDVQPTPPVNNKGADNFKKLHGILAADEVYSQIVPADLNEFISKYSDVSKLQKLHGILAVDEIYSQIMPADLNEAANKYGFGSLGKPSAVPSASEDGGSAMKGRGVEQRSTLPQDYTAEQAKFDIESKIPGAASMNLNYGEISKKMQGKTPAQAVQEHIKTIKDPVEKLNATRSLYKNISSEAAVRATQSRSQLEEMDQSLPLMKESLTQMEAQFKELESTNPNEAKRIADIYEQQRNEFNSLVTQRDGLAQSYEGDAKLIATMNAGRAAEYRIAQSKGDIGRDAQIQLAAVPMNAMFGTTMQYSPADAMEASAWNAIAPNLVRTLAGSLSFGSIANIATAGAAGGLFGDLEEHNPLPDALLNIADAIEIDVDKYVPKEGKGSVMDDINPYTMGKMTGSLLGSVAGSMAGGTARAAQVFNAAQGFGSMYDWGRKHGMNDRDAMLLAAPVGIVYGYLGDKGVEALAGAFGKESTKKLLLEEIKALGANPSKSALAKVAERFVVGALKAAPKEALQESVEFSSEFGLKKGAIEAGIAMPRFGEDYSASAYYKGLKESATVGAAGGGVLGGLFSVASRKTYADIVANAVQNPNAENEFISDIDELVLSGNLTPEQGDAAIANLEKAKAAAAKIPSSVSNPEAISNATELLQEKEDLVAEMEGKDPAMTKPMSERLATIDEELGAIATQEVAPQAEVAPVVEVSQPEIVPQAQPTTEAVTPEAPVAEEAKGEAEQVITLPPEIDSLDDNEIVSIKYETFDEIPESLKSKANKFGGKDVKYRKSILGIPVGKEFTSKNKEGYVVTALGSEIKDAARQTLSSQTEAPKPPQAEAKPVEEVVAKAEAPVAEAAPSKAKASVFADIDAAMEARGTAATEARAAAKETHGKENTDKAIRITREFDKIVKKLEKDGMLTKKCP